MNSLGKILNTTYHDTVDKLTGFYSDLVNNPFYVLNDKKPVICTYYNINKDYSSLDQGSKLHMDNMGSESPIRYNRIYDFILYGFNRIELNTQNGEFGLENDTIEGECYILPNTILPTEGDYFEVEHIKDSTWLFMVQDVQQDTLANGSNAYKISYKLEYLDNKEIQSRIVYNFRMIEVREGTNISRIVRCEDYDIAKIADEKAVMMKGYFEDLFYNEKVQTFIYIDSMDYRTYDPYLIEFLIRNKILDNGEDSYLHVDHKIFLPNTFDQILTKMTLDMGYVIIMGATLSFVGLGEQPPAPALGNMINDGVNYLPDMWWLTIFPAVTIILIVLGFNLLGDGVGNIFNVEGK